MRLLRRFHDLGQNAAHVLGMDEEYERAMRADARLAEHPRALGLELGLGGTDVRHLEADVVLAAERLALQEFDDRRIRTQRLDQLDLRIGRVDEAHADALRRQVKRLSVRLGSEHRPIKLKVPLDRRSRHADMVEAAEAHVPSTVTLVVTELAMKQASCAL